MFVFGAVVAHITSYSQVYDSLNLSRIEELSGVPAREAGKAMRKLHELGALTWEPGKGNRWGMTTLGRASVLTTQELSDFLNLEGAVRTPQEVVEVAVQPPLDVPVEVAIEGPRGGANERIEVAVEHFLEGAVPPHNGDTLLNPTENSYTDMPVTENPRYAERHSEVPQQDRDMDRDPSPSGNPDWASTPTSPLSVSNELGSSESSKGRQAKSQEIVLAPDDSDWNPFEDETSYVEPAQAGYREPLPWEEIPEPAQVGYREPLPWEEEEQKDGQGPLPWDDELPPWARD